MEKAPPCRPSGPNPAGRRRHYRLWSGTRVSVSLAREHCREKENQSAKNITIWENPKNQEEIPQKISKKSGIWPSFLPESHCCEKENQSANNITIWSSFLQPQPSFFDVDIMCFNMFRSSNNKLTALKTGLAKNLTPVAHLAWHCQKVVDSKMH